MKLYLRDFLPYFLKKRLWGDRSRWGRKINYNDSCWIKWDKEISKKFYFDNQRQGIGSLVNKAGYSKVLFTNLENKKVLEIGAGDIPHIKLWKNQKPSKYLICDVSKNMMEVASKKLSDYGIEYEASLLKEDGLLPFEDDSLDIVFSFFCFEHIYPIEKHLNEIKRVLKKGGRLIGCIPTEGGLGWGLGRYLTSRRWMKANTKIDYDKVICWEHPNFADFILKELENSFYQKDLEYYPFKLNSIDFNLVIRFEYINHYD